MAGKLHELRTKRATLAKEANVALDAVTAKAKTDNRELSAEELAAQDDFDTRLAAVDREIKMEERRAERARMYGSTDDPGDEDEGGTRRRVPGAGRQANDIHNRTEDDPARGFRSHRDFLLATMEAGESRDLDSVDERLRPLAQRASDDDKQAPRGALGFLLPAAFTPRSILAAAGSDEQGTYDDRYGGMAVQRSHAQGLLQVGFEGDPTAGRTQAVPMVTPIVDIMARTDKDHTTSVSGGFTVTRRPETVAPGTSRTELEMVTLKAATVMGLAYGTEEVLTDSAISFISIIDTGFRTQFPAFMLNEKIRGKGGNEYLGILNSPALVTVNKDAAQAANTISGTNIINMAARCWGFGDAIWLANHDTRPQLAATQIATGTTGVLLYQPSREEGFPDMLWGRPIFYTEYASALSAVGDIMLVNLTQYLEGLYQPLQSAESIHVRFTNHERAFKFWMRNAGAPWWRSALTPAKSSASLSPFVTLQNR